MENIIMLIIAIVIATIWYAINENKKRERAQSNTHIANKQAHQHTPKVEVQELKFFCVKDKGYHVSVWPNVQGYQNLDYIEFQIAGISHYKATAMKHLGESLAILAAEPDHPYDTNAIRILTSDWQLLGYVPRDMTEEIRRNTSLSCPCFIYIGYRPDKDTFFTDAYMKISLSKS